MSKEPTNSKVTRVQPVFRWLDEHGGNDWPARLLRLANGLTRKISCGRFERVLLDPEREVEPSPARLAWMIRNADRLAPKDGQRWRQLQARTANAAAIKIALKRLDAGDPGGLGQLRLEGTTHADCLIECEGAFIWIEGKRFDWLSPLTTWDVSRDQLARNLEAAWILASDVGKDYCLLICHERPLKHHEQCLVEGYRHCSWAGGWPHLSENQRRDFATRIGTITWREIADAWPDMKRKPELQDIE